MVFPHRVFSVFSGLLSLDSLCRALCCASTALKALVGIDLIVKIAHRDSFSRALCCACAAGQALVGNNKSHDVTSICKFAQ